MPTDIFGDAVLRNDSSGYMSVNYGMLGGN